MSETDKGLVPAAQIVKLCGLADRRLRELANDGYFPKPVLSKYNLAATVQGLLRYYREKDQARILQDSYDSIGNCAAQTGIPIGVLKNAKRNGCTAFKGSRVSLAPLIRWVFEQQTKGNVDIDKEHAQNIVLQNEKLKVELRELNRELVPVTDAYKVGAEVGFAIRMIIGRLHRLAPSLVGQTVNVIEARLKDEQDEVTKQLHTLDKRISEWQNRTQ